MLFIVSTPIGNDNDLTFQAKFHLTHCNILIAESFKVGKLLLKKYNAAAKLLLLNEHSTNADILELADLCLKADNKCVLVSDCGTPLFEDPGRELLNIIYRRVKQKNYTKVLQVAPGASSLMAAFALCPFKLTKFTYLGFLARNSNFRIKEIKAALKLNSPLIILDTAYRLHAVLKDINSVISPNNNIFLALDLTGPNQKIMLAPSAELIQQLPPGKNRLNFVLIIEN